VHSLKLGCALRVTAHLLWLPYTWIHNLQLHASPPPNNPVQVRPGQGPRPEPSRCFSDAALEQVIAAVKEWEELSGAAVTSEGANKQPSLRAVALEHRWGGTCRAALALPLVRAG
jgi:hypothetical protein